MFFLGSHGKRRAGRRQPGAGAALAIVLAGLAGGCAEGPTTGPLEWWHDLEGGPIASSRPPPPGADIPYPHIGPMPDKPAMPDKAERTALLDQLATERDNTHRIAARNPIAVLPPTPPPARPKPAGADDQTANASLPAAEAAPPPPPPPTKTGLPALSGPVVIAGSGADEAGLPPIPATPPMPATFEGVPAEPAPTPPSPLPPRLPPALRGAHVLFPAGQATLAPSQMPTLKDVAAHRQNRTIEIEGYGEAKADTPQAQEVAIGLGLKRAQAIATALIVQHVPETALRLSAGAFGLGASVRLGS